MFGSEEQQCKDCFPHLGTALSCFLWSIFIVWFLHRPEFSSCYLHYMCESVGGAKQAGVDLLGRRCLVTLLHHRVGYSTSCGFGVNIRLARKFWVLKLTGDIFYNTMTSFMLKDQGDFDSMKKIFTFIFHHNICGPCHEKKMWTLLY